ncbi:hypothetical protein TTHT_1560 [Thermotomaculum hydrothermale]|uniref:Uncharacterized protein n=1 Tax=Thermotomaculum hydrothermale TaxID=981385 RepID=A0A7R6PI73_9BACT|nr:hypothetical protein [Thermotomaculum hydrothermale]BBB33054.1 hypothetical protein TTHT_1560 [Thermotomaculum hydrothermale]
MKKVLTFLIIVSMLVFGSSVMARGGKGKGRKNGSCRYSSQITTKTQSSKKYHYKGLKGQGQMLRDGSGSGGQAKRQYKGSKGKGQNNNTLTASTTATTIQNSNKYQYKGSKGQGKGQRLKDGSGSGQQKKNQYKGSKGKRSSGATTATDSTTTS